MWRWIKKRLPTAQSIEKLPMLRGIASWLRVRPYLWKFTQHSVSASIAVSFFVAFLPLPLETLIVAILAIFVRANLPIALFSTLITNVFTLIPISYFNYQVGLWILAREDSQFVPVHEIQLNWSNWTLVWSNLYKWFASLGKPYLVGLPIVSISIAIVSYSIVYFLWAALASLHRKRKNHK